MSFFGDKRSVNKGIRQLTNWFDFKWIFLCLSLMQKKWQCFKVSKNNNNNNSYCTATSTQTQLELEVQFHFKLFCGAISLFILTWKQNTRRNRKQQLTNLFPNYLSVPEWRQPRLQRLLIGVFKMGVFIVTYKSKFPQRLLTNSRAQLEIEPAS